MSRHSERPIILEIHEASRRRYRRPFRKLRYCSTLNGALRAAGSFMMRDGWTGDRIEIYHKLTGMWLATLKLTVRGRIITNFAWEHADD